MIARTNTRVIASALGRDAPIAFVGAMLRMNVPMATSCADPPGVPAFYPATDTLRGTRV